jgi:hypothetical protein
VAPGDILTGRIQAFSLFEMAQLEREIVVQGVNVGVS